MISDALDVRPDILTVVNDDVRDAVTWKRS